MRELKEKIVAYITKGDKLLVFEHADFPDTGLQVPAGTINQGETPIQAAFRETLEETGLKNIEYKSYLGEELYDAGEIGKEELHHRHFFHLECTDAEESWTHKETDPSDGSFDNIVFCFYWTHLYNVPELSGKLGSMLQKIAI